MKRCGFIALVGRPNVGKSTLLNRLLGQKISITSRKPQTTRHHILGIKTRNNVQFIFVDTPGLHQKKSHALSRYMNRAAIRVIIDADVIVFMVEHTKWSDDDDWILSKIKKSQIPVILAINKIDKMKNKELLLPHIEKLEEKFSFSAIIPISSTKKINVEELEKTVADYLPEGEHFYSSDQITDRTERFLAGEFVREQLMRHLGEELPYAVTVVIEKFERKPKLLLVSAMIYVDRKSQKAIIIGKRGERLKQVGTLARLEMEKLFGQKVFLELWVGVKPGWADDEKALKILGYDH